MGFLRARTILRTILRTIKPRGYGVNRERGAFMIDVDVGDDEVNERSLRSKRHNKRHNK